VANSPAVALSSYQTGQVLAFFSLVLPFVLLPVAAFAIDATTVAGREAGLQAATAQAAETGAQQLSIGTIRSTGALTLDAEGVGRVIAQTLVDEEQTARLDSFTIAGTQVSVVASEPVTLPFSVFARNVTLHAHATARLVAGYDTPSVPMQQSIP
jgi:Flp pilus assembly protein TadG